MAPGRYDAVLVDARLGSENGIDLVEALLRDDPAAGDALPAHDGRSH